MDEKILYTGLLKGAIIGKIRYADSLATKVADLIEDSSVREKNIARFTAELIYYYGDMLEEYEEEELMSATIAEEHAALPGLLRTLEEKYGDYFLEILSGRRAKVETIYNEITTRSNVLMDDDEINAIKKCESLRAAEEAGIVFKKIRRIENDATTELYKKSIHYLVNNVISNSGEKDDAYDVWSSAYSELRQKLDKTPSQPDYYQWRPGGSDSFVKTSIVSFFIRICRFRWLDILRKRARDEKYRGTVGGGLNSENHEPADSEPNEENELASIVREAIEQLASPCREIIRGKWFGGDYGGQLTSKELSPRIGLTAGTIDNRHMGCLKSLRSIVNQKMA